MGRHSWTNRIIPLLVAAGVVGCVWYALQSRPAIPVAGSITRAATTPTPTPSTPVADAAILPSVSPVVTKRGSQLQFSVNPTPYKHIQKVEFYIEAHFVGAAFSQPYSVAVNEDNLTAGRHTVTAKIYMDGTSSAKSSQPATFTAAPKVSPAPATDGDIDVRGVTPQTDSETTPPETPAALSAPTDLSGETASDGTSVTLNWTGPEGAVRYQVWRDGTQVATTIGTGFTDTGLNPGQTYDYSVAASDAAGNASAASTAFAVTMPTPTSLDNDPGSIPAAKTADTESSPPPAADPSAATDDAAGATS